MKYTLLVLCVFGLIFSSQAQRVEISPYGGYQFGTKFEAVEGTVRIRPNPNYGVTLDVIIPFAVNSIELSWVRQNTEVTIQNRATGVTETLTDLSVEFFQIGTAKFFDINNDMFHPFAAFTLGAAVYSPQNSELSKETFFAMTLGGGIKILFTKVIGLRFQGRLLMPINWGGVGVFCGTGGCGANVGGGSTAFQADLTGGLVIGIGKL